MKKCHLAVDEKRSDTKNSKTKNKAGEFAAAADAADGEGQAVCFHGSLHFFASLALAKGRSSIGRAKPQVFLYTYISFSLSYVVGWSAL